MAPLEGIKVLDLSRLAPGPFCTMILGDLGADVLMIEAPSRFVSSIPRPAAKDQERENAFNCLRRNKRSMMLNLKDSRGQKIFHALVKDSDVVLEGFRPGVMGRLGSDYDTLSRVNPRIIFCSLTGYGQDGPYADQVGHDINYISMAGMLGMIGWPETPPAIPLNILADFAGGGMHAAMAIMAALIARSTTGKGQNVDISMTDGVIYLLAAWTRRALGGAPPVKRGDNELGGLMPQYNTYLTKDGKWISLGALETKFWENLCRVMECEQWKDSPFDPAIFAPAKAHFQERFRTKTRDEWMKILSSVEICAAPVYELEEALADPHNRARHMVEEMEHPSLGKVRQVGIGPKFSDTPGSLRLLPPEEGEHTDAVLAALGHSTADIEELRKEEVV